MPIGEYIYYGFIINLIKVIPFRCNNTVPDCTLLLNQILP